MFRRLLYRKPFNALHAKAKSISTTAFEIYQNSHYHNIDFTINENCNVSDAVLRFSGYNIGCLAVYNNKNEIIGLCSQMDYMKKVAILNKKINIKVKDICDTNIITVKKDDTLETCIYKINTKNIHYLLVKDETMPEFVGMISVKDLIKEIMNLSANTISNMSDYKGGGIYWL